jgi:galactose-1-phosphate uridylyltransferase
MANTESEEVVLPLTQELIVEVLIARYRLGEVLWPFPNKAVKSLKALTDKGIIGYQSAPTQGSYNVWFTDKGKKDYLSFNYVPPILRDK